MNPHFNERELIDMYLILWSAKTRGGLDNKWAEAADITALKQIIRDENLETDVDAMIFLPDAQDDIVRPMDIMSGLY